jgi:hypothetical protein
MTTALLDPPAPQIDDDSRRREFLAAAGVGLLTLAGCGDDDAAASPSARR